MIGEMRRLVPLLAAIALVAGPLATAGSAMGKEHREDRHEQAGPGRGGGEGRWAGPRQGQGQGPARAPRQAFRGDEYRGPGGYDPRSYPQAADPRMDPRGGGYRADPRYDPRAYAAPPNYGAARRGGYLGPGGGEVIQDPQRLHLRPPPRGYEWVRTPRGWAMVSQSTRQVFDVVPY
jgi:Ni/Co efflux regulator RcnB